MPSVNALRVFIADDHELLRLGLRQILIPHPGWEICGEAANGVDAVANIRELKPDEHNRLQERLTEREREVVRETALGNSSIESAAILNMSVKTVETLRSNIMRKLDLHSVSDLVRYAIRNRIIEP